MSKSTGHARARPRGARPALEPAGGAHRRSLPPAPPHAATRQGPRLRCDGGAHRPPRPAALRPAREGGGRWGKRGGVPVVRLDGPRPPRDGARGAYIFSILWGLFGFPFHIYCVCAFGGALECEIEPGVCISIFTPQKTPPHQQQPLPNRPSASPRASPCSS